MKQQNLSDLDCSWCAMTIHPPPVSKNTVQQKMHKGPKRSRVCKKQCSSSKLAWLSGTLWSAIFFSSCICLIFLLLKSSEILGSNWSSYSFGRYSKVCDVLTFKITSVGTGEPRTTRSVDYISRELKELEDSEDTFLLKVFLQKEQSYLPGVFL